ncbi:MAG: O-antigen ligase family protein [Verrucomicrobiota bacterium]
MVYFIRGTVLPWYLHVPYAGWILITVLSLSLGMVMAIAGGGRWHLSWIIVLLAFAASLTQAEQLNTAGSHWLGLALLILAVGPVVLNPVAIGLRSAAWKLTISGLVSLTAIFVVWYILHLPNFGAGYFSSFMNQCMLAGPIAGMGVGIALARALHGRSWRWSLLAVLGLVPLVAAGSRVAVLATGAAVCFLLVRRKPALGGIFALLFLGLVCGFFLQHGTDETSGEAAGALAHKGTVNSRAGLWQSRIEEFESSPVFGIGVAMGTGSGSEVEEGGAIRVEPGSSYLAVLAMTGAVGFVSFFSALGLLLFGYVNSQRQAGLDRDILNVVGVFLGVHGVAEGWILGFGSPLCFLFWLWLGNVGDAALQPARARTKRRLRALHKFRPAQPALRPLATGD